MKDTKTLTIHGVDVDVINRVRLLAIRHDLAYPEFLAKAIRFFEENNPPIDPPAPIIQMVWLIQRYKRDGKNSRVVTLASDLP